MADNRMWLVHRKAKAGALISKEFGVWSSLIETKDNMNDLYNYLLDEGCIDNNFTVLTEDDEYALGKKVGNIQMFEAL